MGVALEAWVLWWLAAFQFVLAFWWWRGPHLEGTRGWVSGQFLLHGSAALLAGFAVLSDRDWLVTIGELSDLWADVFLVGIAAAAIVHLSGQRWVLAALVAPAVGAIAWVTPGHLWPFLGAGPIVMPGESLLSVAPVSLAMLIGGPALVYAAREPEMGDRWPWALALAVLGVRFAEGATRENLPRLSALLAGDPTDNATSVLLVCASVVMIGSFLALGIQRLRGTSQLARQRLELVITLLAAGFLFGLVRSPEGGVATLTFFTLGFVRPVGFAAVQSALMGSRAKVADHWRGLAATAILMIVSVAGLVTAETLWETETSSSIVVASVFLLLALPIVSRAAMVLERRAVELADQVELPPARAAPDAPADPADEPGTDRTLERDWPLLEADRVALPEDWAARTEDAFGAFRLLPPDVQEGLANLSRWQRVLLLLDALPEATPANAYERSTPGIHFHTHCPYASIGPEIARANKRWKAIVEEIDLNLPASGSVDTRSALVLSTWGRAEGLKSGRVKLYELTPLGHRVAEAIASQLGLPDGPERLELLAEGFPEARDAAAGEPRPDAAGGPETAASPRRS